MRELTLTTAALLALAAAPAFGAGIDCRGCKDPLIVDHDPGGLFPADLPRRRQKNFDPSACEERVHPLTHDCDKPDRTPPPVWHDDDDHDDDYDDDHDDDYDDDDHDDDDHKKEI